MVLPVTWQSSTKLEWFHANSHYPQLLWGYKRSFNILPTNNRYQPIWLELHLLNPGHYRPVKFIEYSSPCVTFDQPLWLKAIGIIEDPNPDIVCRLGGLHTMMSFLRSIDNLMKGSGIEELFAKTYAENSVVHVWKGSFPSITSTLIDRISYNNFINWNSDWKREYSSRRFWSNVYSCFWG